LAASSAHPWSSNSTNPYNLLIGFIHILLIFPNSPNTLFKAERVTFMSSSGRFPELQLNEKKKIISSLMLIVDSQKQFEQGLTLINKVLANVFDAQLTLLKAYFHSRLGQAKPAWDIINSTAEEVRALPFVRGVIARLYLIDKAPEQAVEHAKAAYDATPNSDNALLLTALHLGCRCCASERVFQGTYGPELFYPTSPTLPLITKHCQSLAWRHKQLLHALPLALALYQ
jgi:hypothetical protein